MRRPEQSRPHAPIGNGHVFVLLAAVVAVLPASSSLALATDIQAQRWDGSRLSGQWMGARDGAILEFEVDRRSITDPLDEISMVSFPAALRAPAGPAAFHLHDGGILFGKLTAGLPDAVQAQTAIGNATLGWDKLAAIRLADPTQLKRANELFEEALSQRSPSQDTLVSRDHADVRVLQGRLESLDQNGGSFLFAGESRSFQHDKIYGIIFAAGVSQGTAAQTLVELADGSSFAGTLKSADKSNIQMQASFGASLEVPITDVRRLKFRSNRVEFLSDRKPSTQRIDGVLHAAWPVRNDRNVLGNPISIGGRTFERGLGVHSRTEISYAISGGFERLAATVGIDDAVRPLGSVVMQVIGDGKTLFDSGTLSGVDPPRDILVDISGVQTLTLLVDYGDGLDASDHADWADARLLRPRKSKAER